MSEHRTPPWPGVVLAILASLGMLAAGVDIWLAAAVLLLWIGTLWITRPEPRPLQLQTDSVQLTRDDMRAKFDAVQYDMDLLPDVEDMLAFFTDLQQLSSHRCSPFFRPDEWLDWFERRNCGWVERDGEIVFLLPHQPDDSVAEDLMVDLRARGGCEAVKALIRERAKAGEA